MKWNLRLAAAHRGIWTASEMQRMLAARGLSVSAGKMSGLWSGSPASVKLGELDVICAVLGCGIEELLLPEPLARRYLARLRDPAEGLVPDGVVDPDSIRTVLDLRRRYRPETVDGTDAFAPALAAGSGLLASRG